jgi:hypothetical protein
MHTAFAIAWNVVFGLIACVLPFAAVFRGRRFLKTILVAWAVLVAFVIFSCAVLPPVVGHFDSAVERHLYDSGFDGPFIFATTVLGWIYPLVSALLGYGSRQLWRRFCEGH